MPQVLLCAATDPNDKLIEGGVTDHRDSWNNVMPHIPPPGSG
jgi:hypothetical protein